MRPALAVVALAVGWVLAFGSPMVQERELLQHRYGSPEPILPMTFAHADHTTVGCIECHHNYVDDTGGDNCMHCHVVNEDVWPLLETQFHDLCRGCHEDESALSEAGGPARRCDACHLPDSAP